MLLCVVLLLQVPHEIRIWMIIYTLLMVFLLRVTHEVQLLIGARATFLLMVAHPADICTRKFVDVDRLRHYRTHALEAIRL